MTRKEAIDKIHENEAISYGRKMDADSFLTALEALGLIKFGEPMTPEQELRPALLGLKVEILHAHLAPGITADGPLTMDGADAVLAFIRMKGFKIVKDAP